MNLAFSLDYIPNLIKSHKEALIIYCVYDKFKNDDNIIQITNNDLIEHYGFTIKEIVKAQQALVASGLLKEIKGKDDIESQYRIEAPQFLDEASTTKLRSKFTDLVVPESFAALFDIEQMKEMYKKLGDSKFKISNIADKLKIDVNTLKLYLEYPEFAAKLQQVCIDVREQLSPKVKITDINGNYDALMTVDKDKNGVPIPQEKWKAAQMLRYFCLKYETHYKQRFLFNSANVFVGKEIRDMKLMLERLSNDAKKAIQYVDWIFEVKIKDLKGIEQTGIMPYASVINEFNRLRGGNGVVNIDRKQPVESSFIEWIKQTTSLTFQNTYNYKTLEDLFWLVDAVEAKEGNVDVQAVVIEGRRRGIIPQEGNYVFTDKRM